MEIVTEKNSVYFLQDTVVFHPFLRTRHDYVENITTTLLQRQYPVN